MTRYFMRDTPLRYLEEQMMTPPNFSSRGHGIYHSGFRYKPRDVECRYCTNYDRKHPCSLNQCICLEERIEAGTLNPAEFVQDCFCAELDIQLQKRLQEYLRHHDIGCFLHDTHWNGGSTGATDITGCPPRTKPHSFSSPHTRTSGGE